MKSAFDRASAAIDFLARHRLDPGADNYALAMAYVSGSSPGLTGEIDMLVDGGLRLTAENAAGLAQRYLMNERAVSTTERERVVREQAAALHDMTDEAAGITNAAGQDLARLRAGGSDMIGADALMERMLSAERELTRLREDIETLRTQIDSTGERRWSGGAPSEGRDPLTGLPDGMTAQEIARRGAENPTGCAFAICVLDDLQTINDRYGRSVGDNVLRALASTLQQVSEDNAVLRWSGTEFLVVMEETATASARSLIDEARLAMAARTLRLRGTGAPIGQVTMSAGIVVTRDIPIDLVIERAREGVRAAIAAGGDRVVV